MIKRLISLLFVLCLAVTPVFAAEQDAQSDIVLLINPDAKPQQIEISVPIRIPISLNSDGTVVVDQNLKIENKSSDVDVKLTSLSVTSQNGWRVLDYSGDFSQDNAKVFGLQFRGDNTLNTGVVKLTQSNWSIPHLSSIPLNIKAKFAKQTVDTQQSIGIGVLHYVFST